MAKNNNSYSLIKPFFEFAFVHPECKCQHIALFSWLVELNNKLGWKDQFGLPTYDTMEGLSIGNKNTYYNALRDLETWGFLAIVVHSKNQYQANIIKLCQFTFEPASNQAPLRHRTKHRSGIEPSSDPIVKPLKTGNKPLKTDINIYSEFDFFNADFKPVWDQYLEMRKSIKKPATNSAEILALKAVKNFSKNNFEAAVKIVEQSILNSWQGIYELKQNNNHDTKRNFQPEKRAFGKL